VDQHSNKDNKIVSIEKSQIMIRMSPCKNCGETYHVQVITKVWNGAKLMAMHTDTTCTNCKGVNLSAKKV
jgi:hypothetical protein